MTSSRNRARILFTACTIFEASLATAQLPQPDLQTIFPQGAQIGQTVEVTIGGTDLGEATGLLFSHPGISCGQIPVEATEFQPEGHKPLSYRVSVAPEVPPGLYEVTVRTRLGLTAPRAFAVGTMPEKVHQANNSPETAEELPLNTVMNGHADTSAVDHYKLNLKQGQRVIIRCSAQVIDSRMDGTISIANSSGHEYKRDRDTIGRDPLLDFTAPADDTYLLRVHDFTFAGGAQYPYRVSASDAPHIDFINPPAGAPGTTGKFKIYGRNLPGGSTGEGVRLGPEELESIEVDIPLTGQGAPELPARSVHASLVPGMTWRLEANGKKSNPVRIGFAVDPIIRGEEGQEQTIPVPSETHGLFDAKSDLDQYRFDARKDQPLWIECLANRIRTGSDPVLWIDQITADDKGVEQFKEIASNDDTGGTPGGKSFPILNRDCALRFDPPADGRYRLRLHDYTGRGGPASLYRLIVRPIAPDFDLVVTPWYAASDKDSKGVSRQAALIRRGGTTLLRVFAMRRNGFRDSITLSVAGLPPGVSCPPVILPAGRDTATLVLHGTTEAANWQGFVTVAGKAGETEKTARPGTISWSIGNWDTEFTRARLSQQLPLSVTTEEKEPIIIQPAQDRYEIELGGKVEIPFKLEKAMGLKGDFTIVVSGLPHSKPPSVKVKQDAGEGKLAITFAKSNEFKVEPGEWTFSLRGSGTIKYRHNLSAIEIARNEEARIAGLEKTAQEEAARAKDAIEPVRKALQEAEKNLGAASDDARAALEKTVTEKKTQLQEAEKMAKDAEEKVKRAGAAKKIASDRLKQANEQAKEKDRKHATHSKLITVVVKPPPPKEPGK